MVKRCKVKAVCANSLDWLPKHRNLGSVVTSLPDMSETEFPLDKYLDFFERAALECFTSTSVGHPTIFYQTDRLYKGRRISKASILMEAAKKSDVDLIWHKIALRRDPGKIDLRRPGYSHLLCFGDKKVTSGKATPDVFHAGGVLYPNGTGKKAAKVALESALVHGTAICDPFMGRGTIPAMASVMGFTKVSGVDIDPKQVESARTLRLLHA